MWLRLDLEGLEFVFRIEGYRKSTRENWDCEWCKIDLSVKTAGWLNYVIDHKEVLLCSEVEFLKDSIQESLRNEITVVQELSFIEPDLTFVFHPKEDLRENPDVVYVAPGHEWVDSEVELEIHTWDQEGVLTSNKIVTLVAAEPEIIIELRFELAKPAFCAVVHGGLIDARQENLGGDISVRAGMRQHDVDPVVQCIELRFDSALDAVVGLLIREPIVADREAIVFIDAVRAADGDAPFASEIVDLAVDGEQDARVIRLDHAGSAETLRFYVGTDVLWTYFMVAVDAKQRDREFLQLSLFIGVAPAAPVVDSGIAKDDHDVIFAGLVFLAEAPDTCEFSMGIANPSRIRVT